MWTPMGEVEIIDSPFTENTAMSRPRIMLGRMPIRQSDTNSRPPPNLCLPLLCSSFEVSTFVTEKRYEEHLAGRWLVSTLLGHWGFDSSQLVIERNEHRAPILAWKDNSRSNETLPSISIGHSEGWAVAALCDSSRDVGIDAEPASRSIGTPAFTMMASGDELATLQACPEIALPIWTAKEAVQKALRLGMHLNPRKVSAKWPNPIGNFTTKISIGNSKIQLETWEHKGLRISLAMAGK